jgi:hypothetical protein
MIKPILNLVVSIFMLCLIWGCGNSSAPKNRGAIVFGDSSTIVTEKDPRFLSNNVEDFVPQKAVETIDTTASETPKAIETPKANTTKTEIKEEPKPNSANGLNAPFQSLQVFMEGVNAGPGKKIDWSKDKAASFIVNDGEFNAQKMVVKGAEVNKIMQRVQTIVLIKRTNGRVYKLAALPSSTSAWQTLKGSKGNYSITGLAKGQLKYNNKLSANAIRNAVQKWARSSRLSKKETQQLLLSMRNVRSPQQAPCSIGLQSAVWKISAKDASGKPIEREIRVDFNF